MRFIQTEGILALPGEPSEGGKQQNIERCEHSTLSAISLCVHAQ
jgi:hypothetical protein